MGEILGNAIIISKPLQPWFGTQYIKDVIKQSQINKIYAISNLNDFDDLKDTHVEYLYLSYPENYKNVSLENKLRNMISECKASNNTDDLNLFIINDVNMKSLRLEREYLYTEDCR